MESVTTAQKREAAKKRSKMFCHDCGTEIKIENNNLINGKILEYKEGNEKIKISKCDECYEKNPQLANFRKCEVYSRVVGYLRPVKQWNEGKQEEYSERKEYKCCCSEK